MGVDREWEFLPELFQNVVFNHWHLNQARREEIVSLGIQSVHRVSAPLSKQDLYVAVRRSGVDIARAEIDNVLNRSSIASLEVVGPDDFGMLSYRAIPLGPEHCILLRMGMHPDSGIVDAINSKDSPDLAGHLNQLIYKAPLSRPSYKETISPDAIETALGALVESGERFTAYSVVEQLVPLIWPGRVMEGEVLHALASNVRVVLDSWSFRILCASIRLRMADVIAIDIMRLPSGRTLLVERFCDFGSKCIGEAMLDDLEYLRASIGQYLLKEVQVGISCEAVVNSQYIGRWTLDTSQSSVDKLMTAIGAPYIFEQIDFDVAELA